MSPTTTDSAAGGMLPEPFLDWQAVWPGTSGYETDGSATTGRPTSSTRAAWKGRCSTTPTKATSKLVTMEARWLYGDKELSGDAEALPLRTRLREQGMPDREMSEILP